MNIAAHKLGTWVVVQTLLIVSRTIEATLGLLVVQILNVGLYCLDRHHCSDRLNISTILCIFVLF